MKGRAHHRGKQLERIGESLDIPLDDHPTILRIRTQLPLVSAGSEVIFLFIALLVLICFDALLNYKYAASHDDHLLFLFIDIFCQTTAIHFGTY